MEESQGKATKAHFPEQMWKCCDSNEYDKSIYAGLAKLLQYSRHEMEHRKAKWLAVSKDTDVYLETVEATENENAKVNRTWSR